jgi:integrase
MAILKAMRAQQTADGFDSEYVFVHAQPFWRVPGTKPIGGKQLGPNSASLYLTRKLGRTDLTLHGFRTTFKSWAIEMGSGTDDQDSERALGHGVGGEMSQLYGRLAKRLEPRRRLLEAWAEYCGRTEPLPAKVVPFRQAK